VSPHPCQDPAEADEPEPPKPPRDTELDDDTLVAPPLDDETPLNPRPDDPDPEFEHAIDWPVVGSWQRCGRTTAVVTTPPPSNTNEMAVDRLMARA